MDRVTPSIDEIYFSALEKPTSGERSAYLDQACTGDEDLRRRVERLLFAESRVGNFLESPAPEIAEAFVPSPAECPGTVIGPYTLLEQIGEGGFGIVYIADQEAPVRRQVALKIVRPGMDTRQVLARFKAELEALSLMDHPNIARVLDAGATDAGRPYFVMELVRGVPITDYCDQNHLSVHERLDLFVQVCHAVQHAHQKGIIHRDIKPSNVLVTQHGGRPVPKVIDFGVAKAISPQLTQDTLFTQFAEMIGTPLYMSPEQAEMTGCDIDTRSDVYSLGVLLYELLTGCTPFDKDRLKHAAFDEIRRIIREEEPARPSTRISKLSETRTTATVERHADLHRLSQLVRGDLDWIVMKALEKDRARRYETANSLAMDVQRYLTDEPVQASPPSAGYRLRKFARRNKGFVLAGSAVLVALVAGIVGTSWGMLRATDAQAEAVQSANQKQIALSEKVAALAVAQKSERTKSEQLWQALVAQARAHRLSRRPGQRFESLATLQQATHLARTLHLPAENFQELRNAVIATLAVPDLYLTGPWNTWPADAFALDFDEAQAVYARTDRSGNCSIRRAVDDVEINRLPGLGGPSIPSLSRDGKFIALNSMNSAQTRGTGVQVWQLGESTPRKLLSEPQARCISFRDSQQIAFGYADGAIRVFELPTARQIGRLAPDTLIYAINIALHPTEPVVAISSYFGSVVQLRDLRTGKVLATSPQSDRPTNLAWHPNGRTLAVAFDTSQIRLLDRTTWETYRTLEPGLTASSINFDHAGDRLALQGWGNIVGLFNFHTGEKLITTTTRVATCRFSRECQRLAGAVHDGKVGTWRVTGGQEFRLLSPSQAVPETQKYSHAAVHPDSRLLACGLSDGFGLWDLETGGALAFVPTGGPINSVLFEPSGSLLTLSYEGLSRWPIAKGLDSAGELSIGPPQSLPLHGGSNLGQSRDGQTIVTCDRLAAVQEPHAGGWILHADRPNQPLHLDAGADIAEIAISPDGQWVATATFSVGLSKIWDARDGRFVKELANTGTAYLHFSHDGRWLLTSLDEARLFAVGTWELGLRFGPGTGAVFAPDSKLTAIPTSTGLRLLESASGREIATLEDPNLDSINQVLFAPDGTKLITINMDKGIHVWDLRLIRRELKELRLDWHWPEFPPANAARPLVEPVSVEIRGVDEQSPNTL